MCPVRSARDPASTPPAGQHRTAIVVCARHPIQLRTSRSAPGGQLPLEVLPHHFLRRRSNRPRSIGLRQQDLAISCRLSTVLVRLSQLRRCLVSLLCPLLSTLSTSLLHLVSAPCHATVSLPLTGRRTASTLTAVSRAGTVREQFYRQQQGTRWPHATNIGFPTTPHPQLKPDVAADGRGHRRRVRNIRGLAACCRAPGAHWDHPYADGDAVDERTFTVVSTQRATRDDGLPPE